MTPIGKLYSALLDPAVPETRKSEPAPSLRESFAKLSMTKENDVTLRVYNGGIYLHYDFAQQLLIANGQVRPFSDVPREVLITARERLVELGGTPPELPTRIGVAGPSPQQQRGLNP
jgi:hypothetical protein